ncbi:MAG: hypothetical protein ACTSRZ_18370 [Promethearchaeota archaeon]
MIEKLLLFKESGILLLKKKLTDKEEKDTEELASGFFSVLFQYFSSHFGKIESIKTTDYLILITKIEKIYIVLISSWIKENDRGFINDGIYFLNKRLEEISIKTIKYIENKLYGDITQICKDYDKLCADSQTMAKISKTIDEILDYQTEKMKIIRNINSPDKFVINASKIYD